MAVPPAIMEPFLATSTDPFLAAVNAVLVNSVENGHLIISYSEARLKSGLGGPRPSFATIPAPFYLQPGGGYNQGHNQGHFDASQSPGTAAFPSPEPLPSLSSATDASDAGPVAGLFQRNADFQPLSSPEPLSSLSSITEAADADAGQAEGPFQYLCEEEDIEVHHEANPEVNQEVHPKVNQEVNHEVQHDLEVNPEVDPEVKPMAKLKVNPQVQTPHSPVWSGSRSATPSPKSL